MKSTREPPAAWCLLLAAAVACGGFALPASAQGVDELFGLDEEAPAVEAEAPEAASEPVEAGPSSVDDLFGLDGQAPAEAPAQVAPRQATPAPTSADAPPEAADEAAAEVTEPGSVDDLFGLDEAVPAAEPAPTPADTGDTAVARVAPADAPRDRPPIFGFFQSDLAYTYASPSHVQQWQQVLEVGSKGRFGHGVEWFASVRANADPTFAANDFFPDRVVDDQSAEIMARDVYIDFSRAGLDFRLGRQQIIWGEMVGLFFADVVSARDLRQFVLQDFDMLRMPQWAARAEYFGEAFGGDFHAEAVFIPFMTYDDIGVQGAEYFPFRPVAGAGQVIDIRPDRRPDNELEQAGYGLRLNYLKGGWDAATFFYTAASLSPAFGRTVTPGPVTLITFTPERNREYQLGATLAKDAFGGIFKAEAVYTDNRLIENVDPADADGLAVQDFFTYVAAMEFSLRGDTRFTVQGFQTFYVDHDPGIVPDEVESGFTLLIATRALHPDVEPEILYVSSLNRADAMVQAKVTWDAAANLRLVTGVDFFEGNELGFFGRFDRTDRVYLQGRYSF